MKPNKILTEIRQTRDGLARETGYDLKRLFDYVRDRERKAAAQGVKFISPPPRKKATYSMHEEPPKKSKGNP